jgi:hypothetical protein
MQHTQHRWMIGKHVQFFLEESLSLRVLLYIVVLYTSFVQLEESRRHLLRQALRCLQLHLRKKQLICVFWCDLTMWAGWLHTELR